MTLSDTDALITPKIGSRWIAGDGRHMLVEHVGDGIATLRVLDAIGTMRKFTKMSIANFSSENWSAFLSPDKE